MQRMKLIYANASPYARKVRVVLAEKKLDYQLVIENPWVPETTIGASNPLGKVPCLVLEGGEALFDSRVIVEYLDTLSPVGKLIPTNGRERAEVEPARELAHDEDVEAWGELLASTAGLPPIAPGVVALPRTRRSL